ncbi:hypothetical protein [Streptomyces sp. NPDC052494]
MRVGAAFGALALIVTVPTSANAIDGSFLYQYGDPANPTARRGFGSRSGE